MSTTSAESPTLSSSSPSSSAPATATTPPTGIAVAQPTNSRKTTQKMPRGIPSDKESEEETQEAQVKINLIEDAKDEEEEKRKKEFERRRRLFYAKEYKPNKSEEKANDNDKADDENKNKTQNDINLRLILVSGKTKEFLFSPSDSAGDIAQTVFENWPDDWESELVSKAEILRLIYQGRFLHCNVTLGALGLPLGKTTVMHLVPRDNLPEPNSQDQRQKSKGGSSRCCSTACCIL